MMTNRQDGPRTRLTAVGVAGFLFLATGYLWAGEKPAAVDYCERLEQEIQGRKHGFLAGNSTYYVGGFHACWAKMEDETIGLTHPFHHDLRARGAALVKSEIVGPENTGVGNDYMGWEFYKDTRVLYGSVIINGTVFEKPVPTSMRWRPDRMICVYQIGDVTIREEKFISSSDAAASVITASTPVTLEFSGHSLFTRHSVSSSATARLSRDKKTILIKEGGTMKSRPDPDGPERVGPAVYTGMTTALSASVEIGKTLVLRRDEQGVQHYRFRVPCGQAGVVVSWAMHDQAEVAERSAEEITRLHHRALVEKTAEMNRLLNDEVPWFRCPDERFVDIYYYLWSLYLMYSIDVGRGWECENHTQTAVNNFLGIHRYDATFQIKVGAWTRDKARFAYGNVLTWKHLTQNGHFRELPNGIRLLSDNKGVSWHSGAYGGEASEHVRGAWQIYHHTGDKEFLRQAYEGHFEKLFWKRLGSFAMNEFEVATLLERMALELEKDEDAVHWRGLVRRDPEHVRRMFDQRWEVNGVPNYFAAPRDGMLMTNSFWCMRVPQFPREYATAMVRHWAIDRNEGFFGDFFPLAMAKRSMRKFASGDDQAFGYTPDTAYFTLDGMFRQRLEEAPGLTVNHIVNYNWHDEWGMPVAPEAYRRDCSLFGDQYSNFNAGKILLFLEGFGGLEYSLVKKRLTVRPAKPAVWKWMEIRLPIDGRWTKIRYEGETVTVNGCPLEWRDDRIGGVPQAEQNSFVRGRTHRRGQEKLVTIGSVE